MPASSVFDQLWVLWCTLLVLLMQIGFLFLESGMVRLKNSIHVALKNLLDLSLAMICFGAFGYGLVYGLDFGWWNDVNRESASRWVHFAYQLAFCSTAATIISGAVAERMRLEGYLLITMIVCLIIYPVVALWTWGEGGYAWLKNMGFVDFAGSMVVHGTGGMVALAAIQIIGARYGRFPPSNDSVSSLPPSGFMGQNLGLTTAGALLLWLGWLGFNGGSFGGYSDRVPAVLVSTLFAGVAGIATGLVSSYVQDGLVQVEHIVHGLLGALVATTAGIHVLLPDSAFLVGVVGALIAIWGNAWLLRWRLDDVVGAVSVHAFAGFWGVLAVALFGSLDLIGTGLSRWQQLQVQFLGAAAIVLWAYGLAYALLWLINQLLPLRCGPNAEKLGLNISEHGASSDLNNLLQEMQAQSQSGDFSEPVHVEPFNDIGQVAWQYNRVLERVQTESDNAHANERAAMLARREALHAQQALLKQMDELQEFNRTAVGREHRMLELKQQINQLCGQLGEPPRYDLSFLDDH